MRHGEDHRDDCRGTPEYMKTVRTEFGLAARFECPVCGWWEWVFP